MIKKYKKKIYRRYMTEFWLNGLHDVKYALWGFISLGIVNSVIWNSVVNDLTINDMSLKWSGYYWTFLWLCALLLLRNNESLNVKLGTVRDLFFNKTYWFSNQSLLPPRHRKKLQRLVWATRLPHISVTLSQTKAYRFLLHSNNFNQATQMPPTV